MGRADILPASGLTRIPHDDSIKVILEQRAEIADRSINDALMKELIMKYVESERRLRELNDLKNRFLGMAAHDLRNPLGSIRGFSDVLLEGGIDEATTKEFLTIISTVSNEMLDLLNELLDISVIESGKFTLSRETGDLAKLTGQRVHLCKSAATKKGITIKEDYPPFPEMKFDPKKVSQVMDNLISNAIKFSPLGSEITVSLRLEEKSARFFVEDKGPGISEEDKPKLFGEFQKLSARPTGDEKSTGLGLAIAKKIVAAHGGMIGVVSAPGGGSRFFFTLPIGEKAAP